MSEQNEKGGIMWAGVMKIKPKINWHFAKTAASAFAYMSFVVCFPIFSLCVCLIACMPALIPILIALSTVTVWYMW